MTDQDIELPDINEGEPLQRRTRRKQRPMPAPGVGAKEYARRARVQNVIQAKSRMRAADSKQARILQPTVVPGLNVGPTPTPIFASAPTPAPAPVAVSSIIK